MFLVRVRVTDLVGPVGFYNPIWGLGWSYPFEQASKQRQQQQQQAHVKSAIISPYWWFDLAEI